MLISLGMNPLPEDLPVSTFATLYTKSGLLVGELLLQTIRIVISALVHGVNRWSRLHKQRLDLVCFRGHPKSSVKVE